MPPFDNIDADTGLPDAQLFLYGPPPAGGTPRLICASCNPTGERPRGPPRSPARSPTAATRAYRPRALSAGGNRVFFDSRDRLAIQRHQQRADVYEWEAQGTACTSAGGCVELISGGRSADGASFLDASADGARRLLPHRRLAGPLRPRRGRRLRRPRRRRLPGTGAADSLRRRRLPAAALAARRPEPRARSSPTRATRRASGSRPRAARKASTRQTPRQEAPRTKHGAGRSTREGRQLMPAPRRAGAVPRRPRRCCCSRPRSGRLRLPARHRRLRRRGPRTKAEWRSTTQAGSHPSRSPRASTSTSGGPFTDGDLSATSTSTCRRG